MQLSAKGTGVMSILTSHLRLEDAEVSTKANGQFEERTYKKFGLTIRRRRLLPELPQSAPEDRTEFHPLLPHEAHESSLNNLALSIEAEHSHIAETPAVSIEAPVEVSAEPIQAEQGLAALSAPLEPPALPSGPPPQQHPILSGKTVGVVGFSPQDSAAIGQALAAQYCSFAFLTHADAEFRKGSTNGCDLLILSAPHEWSSPGSLSPASLLKTKKPLLMIGNREDLSTLAMRSTGGLRELVPAPWDVSDMIWRAATLLGRVQEPRGRTGKKGSRKRIIIGDESPARALVHAVLAQEGMECHVADNGVDTVALARSKQADAVIIDVSLPGLDGFQVLAEIRRDPLLKDASVILLTARQSEADVLRGFGLGADDYVTKPFSPMELAARLKRLLLKKS
jgi:CheY-like chemotaxis protein